METSEPKRSTLAANGRAHVLRRFLRRPKRIQQTSGEPADGVRPVERRTFGWYAAFIGIAVGASVVIFLLTGQDAIGATARFLWSGAIVALNATLRVVGSLLGVVARGLGFRQLSRIAAVVAGVELGYAGSTLLGDAGVRRAHSLRKKIRASAVRLRDGWRALPLALKLAIVIGAIASQVYLHSVLIIFPVAFLVPVVRQVWVRSADFFLGGWYWRTFGRMHRRIAARVSRLPLVRSVVGAMRLIRIRYLCAWRRWRYDPRYQKKNSRRRRVSLVEPVRLLWRGDLDTYVGRPLLSGRGDARTDKAA
jgi:hypothetical protein